MALTNTTIKFLRSETIYGSLPTAIQAFDTIQHTKGQPIIAYYYQDDDKTVDSVFAIGMKDGVGRDAYSIITSENNLLADRVIIGDLPDITELRIGQIFLCRAFDPVKNEWVNCWVTRNEIDRIITPIYNTTHKLVKDALTEKLWWVNHEELKECADYNTKEEFAKLSYRVDQLEEIVRELAETDETIPKEVDRLMKKVFPTEIILEEDFSIRELGVDQDVTVILKARHRGLDITRVCEWWMKRESSENSGFRKITLGNENEYIIKDCSQTEDITFKIIYNETISVEKVYTIKFFFNTIYGKFSTINPDQILEGKSLIDFFGWTKEDFEKIINRNSTINNPEERGYLSEKVKVLRDNDSEFVYTNTFKLNEYLFIAIPEDTHKPFSDIRDLNTGESLLEDFILFDEKTNSTVNLDRNEIEDKAKYRLYVRKSGVLSGNKEMSIIFKP